MAFGELVRHHVLRSTGYQFLSHFQFVVPHAIRSADARREIEQSQWLVFGDFAGQLVAHTELGAEFGGDDFGLLDLFIAAAQNSLARLQFGFRASEHAVFHWAFDADFGTGQTTDEHHCGQGG
jgi:hypothetical protein